MSPLRHASDKSRQLIDEFQKDLLSKAMPVTGQQPFAFVYTVFIMLADRYFAC